VFFIGFFALIAYLLFVLRYILPIGGIISWMIGGGIGLVLLGVLYFISFRYITRLVIRPPKEASGA